MATPITSISRTIPTATPFSLDMSFLGTTTFWIVAVFGIIFGIVVFIYFIQKEKKADPFMASFKVKKNQCKMHKDYELKKVFREDSEGKRAYVGMYEGECVDKDGYRNVMFSKFRFGFVGKWLRRIFFFTRPILDLILKKYWIIRCNINPILIVTTKKVVDGKEKSEDKQWELPVPRINEDSQNIIVHCEGLDLTKYFTYPILRAVYKEGRMVVNDKLKNFMRERDAVLIDTLYDQTIDFSNAMREAVSINPSVRITMKTDGKIVQEGGQST